MADAQISSGGSGRALTVSVVTPEGAAYEGEAKHLVAPAFDGEIAFYPMHAPFVGVLGFGELRITRADDGVTDHFYLAGGVVQVADDAVTILAEAVTPTVKLDESGARSQLADAIAMPAEGDVGMDARFKAMDDARARIRVARRSAERGSLSATETVAQPVE